ncbi:MAG: hypothetical protein HY746_07815 [Elusimicrobia bacterium]|nr:hypothetical protein [Elusimicrobiota bacterium]
MEDCKKIKNLIPGMFDREANALEKSAVLSHIEKCQDCAKYYKEIERSVNYLRNIPHEELPMDFHNHLMAKLSEAAAEKPSFRFSFDFLRFPVYAFSSVLAMFFIFHLYRTFNSPIQYFSADEYVEKYNSVKSLRKGETNYIKLNLKSGKLLENVKMETILPEGIVFSNGKKTVLWRGDLKEGNNVIILKVKGKKKGQWKINVFLIKNGMQKSFLNKITVL